MFPIKHGIEKYEIAVLYKGVMMDTRFLQYILTLAETGNMTQAAKKLYVSQPTLSQFLAKQETELGTALFERKNGKYCLTKAGQLYADYARLVLSLTDKLQRDIAKLCTHHRIVFGTSTVSALRIIAQIYPDFCKSYPQLELTIVDHHLRSVDHAITRGDVDIALVAVPSLDKYEGHSVELQREEIFLVVPSQHPYLQTAAGQQRTPITRKIFDTYFQDTPLVLQLPGACIRYLVDAFFDGHPRAAVCNTNSAQYICEMVRDNIGIGFVPAAYAAAFPQLAAFSLEPKIHRTHAILYGKDKELEPPIQLLTQLIQQHYA